MARLTEEQRLNLQRNLKELNNRLHYTIAYVAEHSGVSESSLENYLSNKKGASSEMLQKLAVFYNTTADALISSDMIGTDIVIQKAIREATNTSQKRTTHFETITEILKKLFPDGKGPLFATLITLIQQLGYNVIYQVSFPQEEVDAFSTQLNGTYINKEKTYNAQLEQRAFSQTTIKEGDTVTNSESLKRIQDFMASKKKLLASIKAPLVDQRLNYELFISKYNNGDFDDIDINDLPIEIRLQQFDDPSAVATASDIEDLNYYCEDYPISKFIELLDENLHDFIMDFFETERI